VSLERLWAGWRSDYVGSVGAPDDRSECLFCGLAAAPDDEALVVARRSGVFAVLNLYPYTSGHLMVAPVAHEADLEALTPEVAGELMQMAQHAAVAIKTAYQPDGLNVGMNLGRAAGAGVPGHLHLHVVPRWSGDTNFMTTTAEVRVLPESLSVTLDRLRAVWPT
jgi:ATP adenylyltransferase